MRTGVLSDESIIKFCSRHRPIPMGISKSILQPTLHDTTPYSSKKLKYIKQMSRPKDFDVLATQLTRNSGGHAEIRERLHEALHNEIHGEIPAAPAAPAATAPPATPALVTPAAPPATPALVTPAAPPATPAFVTPAAISIPASAVYRGAGSIDNIFSYNSQQGGRTQVPQTPGVPPMGSLTPPVSSSHTRAGTSYGSGSYVPYVPPQSS
jgi:hypothetical protein